MNIEDLDFAANWPAERPQSSTCWSLQWTGTRNRDPDRSRHGARGASEREGPGSTVGFHHSAKQKDMGKPQKATSYDSYVKDQPFAALEQCFSNSARFPAFARRAARFKWLDAKYEKSHVVDSLARRVEKG